MVSWLFPSFYIPQHKNSRQPGALTFFIQKKQEEQSEKAYKILKYKAKLRFLPFRLEQKK